MSFAGATPQRIARGTRPPPLAVGCAGLPPLAPRHHHRRRGTVLVMAIWVILILAALVMVYTRSMRVELVASGNRLAAEQAAAVERGAEQFVLARVDGADGDAVYVTEAPAEGVPVGDGYFWILRPRPDGPNQFDYGIVDEASKLNINVADALELAKLPGVTEPLALAIMDWRDADMELTPGGGAETEHYQSLVPPYACKNGPFETIEELRLVKGAVEGLVYGTDRNQNGAIDDVWPVVPRPGTPVGGPPMLPGLNADQRGIAPFVTVSTIERNVDRKGNKRVNVKGEPDNAGPGTPGTPGGEGAPQPGGGGAQAPASASQVVQPTPGQPTPGQPGGQPDPAEQAIKEVLAESLQPTRADEILAKARGSKPYNNVFDFAAKGGMTADELSLVFDRFTSETKRVITGRVNVNTAPREVLRCLPGLETDDAEALVNQRSGAKAGDVAWVLNALTPEKLNQAGGLITGRSFQYSADIVAVSGDGRAFKRVRIVVDARQSPPVIVRRRDLTSLGWPLGEDVRAYLKSGQRLTTTFRPVRAQGLR